MASLPVTEHEPAQTQSVATPATTGWGLFRGALAVAVVLLLVGALTWIIFGYATGNFVDADAKRVLERTKILADRNAEDAKLLHDPASWQAKDKGIVRVPIDRAIALAMTDLKEVQPHPAYPIKQSPPQPANAPTAASKGTGVPEASAGVNPPASNPTVGQPSPAPVATTPTPAPATSASSPVSKPAAASTPASASTLAATPVPTATPLVSAPKPDNNANNPGTPPIPGTAAQPPAPSAAAVPSIAPSAGSKPEPLMTPPAQPTPAGNATPAASDAMTPTPAPTVPGAGPSGTP